MQLKAEMAMKRAAATVARRQRAKREEFWQTFGGGVLALAGIALWFMASGIAGVIAP